MFRALVLGFGQLTDPRCRRIVWVSVLGAIALAIALVVSVSWLFIGLQVTGIVWLEPVIDVLGGAATLVIAWLLFPAAIGLLVGLFLDRVSRAVEQRHYPDLPAAPGQSLLAELTNTAKLAALAITLNLLLMPVYLFIPIISVFIFFLLNGYLLGREYFSQVALRRLDRATTELLWKRYKSRIWMAGSLIALIASIPFVNLVAAVVATAFMTHLFEDLRRRAP